VSHPGGRCADLRLSAGAPRSSQQNRGWGPDRAGAYTATHRLPLRARAKGLHCCGLTLQPCALTHIYFAHLLERTTKPQDRSLLALICLLATYTCERAIHTRFVSAHNNQKERRYTREYHVQACRRGGKATALLCVRYTTSACCNWPLCFLRCWSARSRVNHDLALNVARASTEMRVRVAWSWHPDEATASTTTKTSAVCAAEAMGWERLYCVRFIRRAFTMDRPTQPTWRIVTVLGGCGGVRNRRYAKPWFQDTRNFGTQSLFGPGGRACEPSGPPLIAAATKPGDHRGSGGGRVGSVDDTPASKAV
jgi:hypothetical protein